MQHGFRDDCVAWMLHNFAQSSTIATSIRWIALKMGTDICRINLDDFSKMPSTTLSKSIVHYISIKAPPSDQNFIFVILWFMTIPTNWTYQPQLYTVFCPNVQMLA